MAETILKPVLGAVNITFGTYNGKVYFFTKTVRTRALTA
jgi:hypothetical protein